MAPDISTLRPDRFLRFPLHLLATAFALLLTATSNLFAEDTPGATRPASALPAEITGSGTVIDADTGQPVAGAKVTLREFGPDNLSRHHECLSHGDGKFEFTVPTDHTVADSGGTVGIEFAIDVKHPNYVLPISSGWLRVAVARPSPAALLRRQLQAAAPQAVLPQVAAQAAAASLVESPHVLRPIRVVPAKPITGILQSPDGKPGSGVRIYAFSSRKIAPELQMPGGVMAQANFGNLPEYQASLAKFHDDTTTGDEGRFQLMVPAAGETLLSICPAKDFALSNEYIADKRGDLGTVTLKPGRALTGRIVGEGDKPLAGVYMEAQGWAAPDPSAPQVVREHPFIWRVATTDAEGNFAFAPLSPGEYVVIPRETASDLSTEHRGDPPPEKHPLTEYFAPQKVTLSDDEPPHPLEIRPTPMVQISGHVAMRQFGPTIRGLINGFLYQADAEIDVQGNFKVRAPRGLTDGILYLQSVPAAAPANAFGDSSQPSQAKWRTDRKKPLVTGNEIPLGEIDADTSGIEIVYPDPPKPDAPARPGLPRGAAPAANANPSQ